MAIEKPSLPKGTRDFGPAQMARRNYILSTIRQVYEKYGFQPLETPAMENLSVLTGKYGDEGDQLLFKILNSGDFLSDTSEADFREGFRKVLPKVAKKGLRYDLTVPFARFVVMNQHELIFPFRRYQIQPVWRADRPQKGRYQEFFQCDADVVGTDSLLCEAEIVAMIFEVFNSLKITDFTIKINNRKILTGIAEAVGAPGKEGDLCVAIDKLDKIGQEKVEDELRTRGFSDEAVGQLRPVLALSGSNEAQLATLDALLTNSETGRKGLAEIRQVLDYVALMGLANAPLQLDTTLARGLTYYTGAIFEVKVNNVQMGSLSGGGRYDNLTGVFGMPNMSGVGISFGVDRIYDVMNELDLYPAETLQGTTVLFVNFDAQTERYCLPVVQALRAAGVKAELFPSSTKMAKQLTYANKKNIPFVVLAGEDEIGKGTFTLKNMVAGTQQACTKDELFGALGG